jgi:hypothetical protein
MNPISVKYILILALHQGVGPPSGLFSTDFPIKAPYAFLFFLKLPTQLYNCLRGEIKEV